MNSVTAVRHGRQGCALLAPGIRQPEKTFGHADSRGRKAGKPWIESGRPYLEVTGAALAAARSQSWLIWRKRGN
jgi:hypothetical protein